MDTAQTAGANTGDAAVGAVNVQDADGLQENKDTAVTAEGSNDVQQVDRIGEILDKELETPDELLKELEKLLEEKENQL